MAKSRKLTQKLTIRLTEELHKAALKKGIRPEHFRQFVEAFDRGANQARIKSDDWRRLKDILIKVPSLQLIGDVGAGKSHLVRELVKNDRDHIYIVLDSHHGFDFLPRIHQISPTITKSSVLEMNKMDDAAGLNFKMYKSLIQYDTYPKNFVLVVEESLRYKKYGIVNMLAESRKFIKVLAITQARLVDFVPEVHVENYNRIRI